MHMYFWAGTNVGRFLVYSLNVQTTGSLVGMCFLIGGLTFLFEYLRYLQTVCRHKELLIRSQQLKTICPDEGSSLLSEHDLARINRTLLTRNQRIGLVSADIGIWYSLLILAYFLMLIIMTYNVWFFISAIFGAGLGYFVFGQMLMRINLENYRILQETFCAPNASSIANENGESTPALERSNSVCPKLKANDQLSIDVNTSDHCDQSAVMCCDIRKCTRPMSQRIESTSSNPVHEEHQSRVVVDVHN